MKKERLSAKEWLEENKLFETFIPKEEWEIRMERYANYKSKMFQAKIFQFRGMFKDTNMLRRIDEHFNIVKTTEGKI